jgi:class 3 adenylate cyclase
MGSAPTRLAMYCLAVPQTRYAQCGDLSLAFQVFGEGQIDLVISSSFISHIELSWTIPEAKAWYDQLGSFCRVLIFDKAGVGLSDPVPKVRTIEDRAAEIEAVMDAAGFDGAALMGISEGGPASIMFAATRPGRVKALILTGTFAHFPLSWDIAERRPEEVSESLRSTMGDEYMLSAGQINRLQPITDGIRSNWGSGQALQVLLPSVKSLSQLGMLERMSASPGMARVTVDSIFRIDVRSILPTIHLPTLVVHATDDPIPVQGGRYLAAHIPGARFVEIVGHDHAPFLAADPDHVNRTIEEFLTGSHAAPRQSSRALKTVLFTDMVSSTERASAMGDQRWSALLRRFGEVTADAVDRFGGIVVKSTGDGHLTTFDGPTNAIRCAESLCSDTEALGVEVRAGIHTGECELIGDDIGGIAVHIAARIMSTAGAGEIVVSSSLRDLVVGSGIGFSERGTHQLKGVPGTWQLLAVDPDGPKLGSSEAALVSHPTPSPRAAMRRSDRTVATMARRAPWLLRGIARLAPSPSAH